LNYTKEDVCEKIQKYTDYSLHYTDAGNDPEKRDYEVSYEKIRSTGFEAQVSLEDGIQRMIDSYEMIHIKNPYSNYGT
jgi:nucleoside-diphosphate-sugar epimerase